jgi:hypothetical protein
LQRDFGITKCLGWGLEQAGGHHSRSVVSKKSMPVMLSVGSPGAILRESESPELK